MFEGIKRRLAKRFFMRQLLELLPEDPGRLVELVFQTEVLWRGMVSGILSDRTKSQALLSRSDTLLRFASGNENLEQKVAVAVANLAGERPPFRSSLRDALYKTETWGHGVLSDHQNLSKLYRMQGRENWQRHVAAGELHVFLDRMAPWLEDGMLDAQAQSLLEQQVNAPTQLRKAFYQVLCADGDLPLRLGRVRLPDPSSFWPQLHEIFVREDYDFEADSPTPYIIDAGMHMGLATYYFKAKYPGARIVAFEPSAAMRQVAEVNINSCGFADVTIEPYALSANDGPQTFYPDADDSMAGSLQGSDGQVAVTVEGRRLSPYLDRPVSFLKLDIEGAEGGVLAEASGRLGMVQHIFIEFHENHLPENRLPALLKLLDDAGFDFEVAKSHGYQLLTEQHPMRHVGQYYSAVVWAKNRAWPPAGTA